MKLLQRQKNNNRNSNNNNNNNNHHHRHPTQQFHHSYYQYFITSRAEPILHHLKEHPNHMVEPVVDTIREQDLKYAAGSDTVIQGFTWSLLFWWMMAPKRLLEEQSTPADPIK